MLLQQLGWPLKQRGSLWNRDRPTNRHRNQQRPCTSWLTRVHTLFSRPFTNLCLKFQASSPVLPCALLAKVRISGITSRNYSTCLRDTNFASKVQLYEIPSFVCPGKSLTFDFYASYMDSLWTLDRTPQSQQICFIFAIKQLIFLGTWNPSRAVQRLHEPLHPNLK